LSKENYFQSFFFARAKVSKKAGGAMAATAKTALETMGIQHLLGKVSPL